VWSAGTPDYVAAVVETLPTPRPFDFCWSARQCRWEIAEDFFRCGKPLEDLRRYLRCESLSEMLVVDDAPNYVLGEVERTVPVEAWHGDPADRELDRVLRRLALRQARFQASHDMQRLRTPQ
jgi:hypothetical protein